MPRNIEKGQKKRSHTGNYSQSPYLDEKGRVVPYWHHETWHDDNGSSHIKAALLSPFITVPFVNGKITVGPWQNLTLIECDTRDRVRDIVFQVMGE